MLLEANNDLGILEKQLTHEETRKNIEQNKSGPNIITCKLNRPIRYCSPGVLIFALFLQNTINLTETNTQYMYDREPRIFKRGSYLSTSDPFLQENTNQDGKTESIFTNMKQGHSRSKISPTRIKLTNAKLMIDRNFFNSNTGRTSRNYSKLHPSINSARMKSKHSRQMAPAYELWPEINGGSNLVFLRDRKNYNLGNVSSSLKLDEEEEYLPRSYRLKSSFRMKSKYPKDLRGLLPKPVRFVSSESKNRRTFKTRSIPSDKKRRSALSKREEGQQQPNSEEEEEVTGNEVNEVDENVVENDEMNTSNGQKNDSDRNSDAVVPKTSDVNTIGRRINFKVFDSKQARRAESRRKLQVSPVYPPGDLDRLYSDALLVYIKDFNQFIKK